MEEQFKILAWGVALVLEVFAVVVIAIGAGRAAYHIARSIFDGTPEAKKDIWVRFGVWLLLGLEFELGADIVESVVAPTWVEIGRLAAIAVIRTFLNYFLTKDIEKAAEGSPLTIRGTPVSKEGGDRFTPSV